MSLVVAVVGGEVGHPQRAVPDPLHLAVPAGLLRQTVRALRRDAEDVHLSVTGQDLRPVDRGVHLLRNASETVGGETNRGLLVMTAGGYPGINHDLLPLKRKQAHQRPGCQGRDHVLHHAAVTAQDQAVHGL